jgi:methionyl-tRNA formyltransferase
VVETLERLGSQTVAPTKQAAANEWKNAPKIFREDCKINWQLTGKKIEQFIRGLSPYPGAFSEIVIDGHATDVKILMAEFHENISEETSIGAASIENKKLFVRTLDGRLEVKQLQLQGKRPMIVLDFINGLRQSDVKISLC